MPVDVTATGVDFLVFSGHKMLGPTGIGVLWGRAELLAAMPPFLTGGSMIETVTHGGHDLRRRRRSGSRPACPMTAQAIGLGAAVDYLTAVGMDAVAAHEHALTRARWTGWRRSTASASSARSTPMARGGAVSFVVDGIHPHDVGQVLDDRGRRGPGGTPLRLAADPALRRAGHHAGDVLPLQRPTPTSTRSWLRSVRHNGSGRWRDAAGAMYQEIILDHYRRPHHRGLREPFDAEVHHVNPTCGDEVTRACPARRAARVERRLLRRAGLLDQPGQRVGHDRPGHRATRRRGVEVHAGVPRAHAEPGQGRRPTKTCSRTRWRSRASRSTRRA